MSIAPASPVRTLEPAELKELLIKSWLTHDAMWFRHCAEALGLERANQLNLQAVRSMAAVEIRRLVKALGLGEVRDMNALRALLDGAWQLIRADFMGFRLTYPRPNVLRWETDRCFAFDGVSQLGAAAQYHCGIFPRMETWLETLGVRYTVAPAFEGCLMHQTGACAREYTFSFDEAPPA
ncbi:MAG: hypothetical protein IT371_28615 [Deltaproteobacteria bacterium]|nr:hypothetical protein [Deltaproteobacteria bacterium]